VVKEKSYFAPTIDAQGCEPCRGADLLQRRDLRGSGGVVPKLRVAAETGLESNLFSDVPRRVDINGRNSGECRLENQRI
jgi:hypothetical protein